MPTIECTSHPIILTCVLKLAIGAQHAELKLLWPGLCMSEMPHSHAVPKILDRSGFFGLPNSNEALHTSSIGAACSEYIISQGGSAGTSVTILWLSTAVSRSIHKE